MASRRARRVPRNAATPASSLKTGTTTERLGGLTARTYSVGPLIVVGESERPREAALPRDDRQLDQPVAHEVGQAAQLADRVPEPISARQVLAAVLGERAR